LEGKIGVICRFKKVCVFMEHRISPQTPKNTRQEITRVAPPASRKSRHSVGPAGIFVDKEQPKKGGDPRERLGGTLPEWSHRGDSAFRYQEPKEKMTGRVRV